MEAWYYVLGIAMVVVGGVVGYLIVVYLNPFPKSVFKKRMEDIDRRLAESEENPLLILEAEIEKMNERISRLERILLKEGSEETLSHNEKS